MSQIKIIVSQQDIDSGHQGIGHGCAIARALRRQLATTDVVVPGTLIRVDGKTYKLPKKGRQFVATFDKNKAKAKPFSFMLREDKAYAHRGSPVTQTPIFNHYYVNWSELTATAAATVSLTTAGF